MPTGPHQIPCFPMGCWCLRACPACLKNKRGKGLLSERILVTGGKGGVGKSTVCAMLGMALARDRRRTLLVEAGQRSLDVMMGCETVLYDFGDLLEGRCSFEDARLSAGGVDFLCAPQKGFLQIPENQILWDLFRSLENAYDFILIEVPCQQELLSLFARFVQRAVIISTTDRACARGGRMASDLLARQGIYDIRLCINMLPPDFLYTRPVPDLDWLIDTVCAQLICILPFEFRLISGMLLGNSVRLSHDISVIFDNFAQRILGKYIDLSVW